MQTLKTSFLTLLGCILLIAVIALTASALLEDRGPDPYDQFPPAKYRSWENSPDPFAQPQDYIRQVGRLVPRRLHLMRPDLIGYPLFIESYA